MKKNKRPRETNPFDDDTPAGPAPGHVYKGEPYDETASVPATAEPMELGRDALPVSEVEPTHEEALSLLSEITERVESVDEKKARERAALLNPGGEAWGGIKIGQSWPLPPRPPRVAVNDLQTIAGVKVVFFVSYLDQSMTTHRLPVADFLKRFRA